MRRWAAIALVASLCVACSEQSSLYVQNDRSQAVVVRVFFNDFAESFGFDVPAGARAWAWAPLEGRVSGPIAVFDQSCNVVWHQEIRSDGGHLGLDTGGGIVLTAPPTPSAVPDTRVFLEFTDKCAGSGSPGD